MADISAITVGSDTYNIKDATARSELAGKQDTLTAGTGISISDNVISATGGTIGTLTSAVTGAVGATSVTISHADIATTSILFDLCENSSGTKINVNPINVTTGQAVLHFDPLEEATSFKLLIINM